MRAELELDPAVRAQFPGLDAFDQILNLQGQAVRQLEGRRTLRVEWERRGYYIKIHHGVGWIEIFKNLASFRLPVFSALNELRAIRRLERLGVPTLRVVGFGARGMNPARRESFLITEELRDMVSLARLCAHWENTAPPVALRWALIERVAGIARALHRNGLNHRDFYLCHFLLARESLQPPFKAQGLRLYLIDLHRMQCRRVTPRRWIVKDLAGLLFSSLDAGLSRKDLLRFVRAYEQRPLREVDKAHARFWRTIHQRAIRLYRRVHEREPILPT